LRKLRAAYHDPLFLRAANGVAPTPRAHTLVRTARPLVNELRQRLLAEETFDPGFSDRSFTFALSDIGEMVFLPRLLERLRAQAPNAAIRSVSMPPLQIAAGLESGEIDLAIGHFPDLTRSSFFQQRLFTHAFACLLRAGHPRRARQLSLADFLAMEHAVVRTEGRSQEIFERFLDRKKIRRKIVLYTPHFLSLPMIIARSDLVTTVPHAIGVYFSRLSGDLALARPPFDIAGFDLKQHWHRKYHSDPRNQWLRKQVALLFNDDNDEYRVDWKLPPRR